MRASVLLAPLLLCLACGQKIERSAPAAGCDPTTMHCVYGTPISTGNSGPTSEGGAGSGDEVATLTGTVLQFGDDYFVKGNLYNGMADVTAIGASGSRVDGTYDGMSFSIDGVLKTATNWFLITPTGNGTLPTITPADTRSTTSVTVGLATTTDVDGIFSNLATERATDQAQIVVTAVDSQSRSVTGVKAAVSGIVAYRVAAAWLETADGTDDSGMIFLGNVSAGSALSTTTVTLSGTANANVDVAIQAGAITIVTAVVE